MVNTLAQIEALNKDILVPADIAAVLGSDPQTIRWVAKHEPQRLGFPVIVIKNRVKIPRDGFLSFCRGQIAAERKMKDES